MRLRNQRMMRSLSSSNRRWWLRRRRRFWLIARTTGLEMIQKFLKSKRKRGLQLRSKRWRLMMWENLQSRFHSELMSLKLKCQSLRIHK